ncbi:hypothetical protein J2J97_31720 (plasmid) [Rhizobium bangladeshense]|uniref:hypothetical protein n=1 Tax=Rhizobium bangladeshense TaxID=1138189 RepID=UPI001A97F700|nr:hypothetical protein [Rhizobium bangladeshense]QSY98640.1 hypothetical protein J2J97_31720 [Rhizobium bangladeshense]
MIKYHRQPAKGDEADLKNILQDKETKDYQDLRDRAAYVYVTGTFPTHLRSYMMSLLRIGTHYSMKPVALDGRSGSMELTPEVRKALDLEDHPMVSRTRDFVEDGYKIFFQRDVNSRRPYSKVLLYKKMDGGTHKLIVQADGSILEGWPEVA